MENEKNKDVDIGEVVKQMIIGLSKLEEKTYAPEEHKHIERGLSKEEFIKQWNIAKKVKDNGKVVVTLDNATNIYCNKYEMFGEGKMIYLYYNGNYICMSHLKAMIAVS